MIGTEVIESFKIRQEMRHESTIGFLAEKGYNLAKGKQGKGKIVVLIIVIILGVLLGTLAADAISLAQMIGSGELPDFTYGEIPTLILFLLLNDSFLCITMAREDLVQCE